MTSGPQGSTPGRQRGTAPAAGDHGEQRGAPPAGGAPEGWSGLPRAEATSGAPVAVTRVAPRRVIQYIIDSFLAGIVPALVFWAFDRGSGARQAIGWLLAVVIWVLIMVWYWVLRPHGANGQTFGMQLLRLRIISKDGGPADKMQLLLRWILLIVDTLVFGLVGLLTMLFSHYRQRVGDHAAKTLVVRSG